MSKLKNLKGAAPVQEAASIPATPATNFSDVPVTEKKKRTIPEGFGKKRTPEQEAAHALLITTLTNLLKANKDGLTVKEMIAAAPAISELPGSKVRGLLRDTLNCVATPIGTSQEKRYSLPV